MHAETLRKALCLVFGSCAFSFNLLLVYAILTVQCAYIGKYKWLLFLYTLSGIFNGAAQILTMPHMLLTTNGFVFYGSLRLLPPYVSDVVVLVYTSCFFQNLVILTLCFIYRYYAVCEPEKFSQFLKDWLKTISISIGIVGIEMIGLAYVSRRSGLSEQLMDEEFISVTGFSLTDTGYIGNLLFTRTGLNTEMLFLALSYTIISSIQGCIMIKLALRIAKTLRNSLPSSRTVAKHQKKIFTLLLYQLVMKMDIEFLRKILCLIFGSTAFFFNFLLAFIILTVKCDHIGKYKWLLFLYTLSAMLNGGAQIITMPHMTLNSHGNVFYDSLRILPIFFSDIVLLIYSSCFFQNLIILTHCFIFRYYAVCNPDNLSNFVKNWPKIAVISTIILVAQMVSLVWLSPHSPEYEELMDAEFIESTGYSLKDSSYWACVVYTKTGLNTDMLLIVVIFGSFNLAGGAIMIRLALKIAKTLKSCTWSKTLILPLVFNILPLQIVIFSNYFHLKTGDIVHIFCCFLTFPPAIDPLLIFYLIKPYRKALFEKISLVKARHIRQACSTTVIPVAE